MEAASASVEPHRAGAGLPLATAAPDAKVGRAEWLELAGRAKRLSWISLVVITLEAAVALTAGIIAGSVALIGVRDRQPDGSGSTA